MRLWSLHPSLLDTKGLVALWREALLAQHVLHGKTKGYRHHPQLQRFQACKSPKRVIAAYLAAVQLEATRRGYNFNKQKILAKPQLVSMTVTQGQMAFEFRHLSEKLRQRAPQHLWEVENVAVRAHPLFSVVPGDIEE